jgi:hypothetical protein
VPISLQDAIRLGERWGIDPRQQPVFQLTDDALGPLLGGMSVRQRWRLVRRGALKVTRISPQKATVTAIDLIEFLAARHSDEPAAAVERPRGRPRKRQLTPRIGGAS